MKSFFKYLLIIFISIVPFVVISCGTITCIIIDGRVKISPNQYEIKTAIHPSCSQKEINEKLNEEIKNIMDENGYKLYLIVQRNLRSCTVQLFSDTKEKSQAIEVLRGKKNKFIELSKKYIIGVTSYKQFSDDVKTLGGTEHQIEIKEFYNPYHSEILSRIDFGGLFVCDVLIKDHIIAGFNLVDVPLEFPE